MIGRRGYGSGSGKHGRRLSPEEVQDFLAGIQRIRTLRIATRECRVCGGVHVHGMYSRGYALPHSLVTDESDNA